MKKIENATTRKETIILVNFDHILNQVGVKIKKDIPKMKIILPVLMATMKVELGCEFEEILMTSYAKALFMQQIPTTDLPCTCGKCPTPEKIAEAMANEQAKNDNNQRIT